MSDLTLSEVCVKYGVTRRTVQGYERYHLVAPTGKTSRGYLLYDERAQRKICRIKRLQDCGFHLSEIRKLCESDENIRKEMFQTRYDSLLEERAKLDVSITWLEQLITKLLDIPLHRRANSVFTGVSLPLPSAQLSGTTA